MRSRRFSFVAGWVALTLLAIVGFAAFAAPDDASDEVLDQAEEASLGHTAGAYAGLGFALPPGEEATATPLTAEPEGEASPTAGDDPATVEPTEDELVGTIASPASGWLSEVEVRALVSLYFEPTDVNRAVRIAWCESRFDPNHTDLRTGGVGLFNHLPRYWAERAANAGFPDAEAIDAQASTAAAAWEVYNGAGWDIFTCR